MSQALTELSEEVDSAEDLDLDLAKAMIAQELTPFYEKRDIDLAF